MDYLRYAECFYTLGKTLSFTKASLQLGIAQPAISRQIRLLEEQLGLRLFIRTKHQVSFTRESRSFYQRIAPLLERMQTEAKLLKGEHELAGSINIGTLDGLGEEFLLPITLQFKKKFPQIHLNIFYLKTEEISEGLMKGEIDFAFFNEFIDLEIIRSYELFTEKSFLVTRMSNQEVFDPKMSHFISYKSEDPLVRSYIKKFHPSKKKNLTHSVFTVNSISALLKTLKQFNYYSVLAEHIIKKEVKSKKFKIIDTENFISSKVYFSYLDQEFMPKRLDHFREFFLNKIKSYSLR